MSYKIFISCLFILLSPQTPSWANVKIMNDITFNDFVGFEKNWRFVTVRYRKDTGEMRFTYANEIAWKHLQSHSKDYPDGAVFAKLSLLTQVDEAFPSSVMPTQQRRYQYMVRNKAKYAQTGGWGYALFDPSGNVFKGDIPQQSQACAACHQIVADRGQVFSKPIALPLGPAHIVEGVDWTHRFKFKQVDIKNYAPLVAVHLPPQIKEVRVMTGSLEKNYFFGTFDEIRPLLIEEVRRSKKATALVSEDKKQISIVFPSENKDCSPTTHLPLTSIHTVPNKDKPTLKIDLCEQK